MGTPREDQVEAQAPVLVVANPAAGGGAGAGARETLERALTAHGLPFRTIESRSGSSFDTPTRAERRAVVVVGGDGTLNEVVNTLAHAAPTELGPLVVLAAGSGNDFAAMTGSPTSADEVVRALTAGARRVVDLGRARITDERGAHERWFANSFGTGFEAFVNRAVQSIPGSGVVRYLRGVLRALGELPRARFTVEFEEADGATHALEEELAMLTVGNTARTGGGFRLTPDARPDDGLLDALLVRAVSRPRVLTLLPGALSGRLARHRLARVQRFTRLTLRVDPPMPVALDGELVSETATEVQVTVEPARLTLLVPSDQETKRASTRSSNARLS